MNFYLSWFSRVYHNTDGGWFAHRTPDDKPIAEQDAYFWFALEIIARELNAIRAAETAKMNRT